MTKQKSAKDFDEDRIEIGCGCVFCDIGLYPVKVDGEWKHVGNIRTGRVAPCTNPAKK